MDNYSFIPGVYQYAIGIYIFIVFAVTDHSLFLDLSKNWNAKTYNSYSAADEIINIQLTILLGAPVFNVVCTINMIPRTYPSPFRILGQTFKYFKPPFHYGQWLHIVNLNM